MSRGLIERILDHLADRVNAKNAGAFVNLSGYTSSSNTYTFPSDGYVFAYNAQNSTSVVTILGATDSGSTIAIGSMNYGRDSIFVKKGMRCWVQGSFSAVRFSPISGGGTA